MVDHCGLFKQPLSKPGPDPEKKYCSLPNHSQKKSLIIGLGRVILCLSLSTLPNTKSQNSNSEAMDQYLRPKHAKVKAKETLGKAKSLPSDSDLGYTDRSTRLGQHGIDPWNGTTTNGKAA